MIIAVDFDGVLNSAPYPSIGDPVEGAVDGMRALREAGHYLVVWTCREGIEQTRAVNWLLARGIPFDAINANHPNNIRRHGGDCRKVYADLYVDDRQVGGFPGWKEVLLWTDALAEAEAMSADLAYEFGNGQTGPTSPTNCKR